MKSYKIKIKRNLIFSIAWDHKSLNIYTFIKDNYYEWNITCKTQFVLRIDNNTLVKIIFFINIIKSLKKTLY